MALPGMAKPMTVLSKVAFAITGTKWNGPPPVSLVSGDKEDRSRRLGNEGCFGQAGPVDLWG